MKASDGAAAPLWLRALPVLVAALLLAFSVRADSLWMDEGQTLGVLGHGSLAGLLRDLAGRGNAVSGMPLYFLLENAWCRAFGTGEFAMRASNYLAAALALLGALRLASAAKLPGWTVLPFAANPMLLYYMNEARPYAALYACGLWGTVFLIGHADREGRERRRLAGFFACWLAACALHMMAVFAGAAYLCFAVLLWRAKKPFVRNHLAVGLCFAPFFAALGFFYLRFALGSPELGFPTSPLAGVLQIAYYFAGLGGLGWARNALREMTLDLTPRVAVELGAALLAWGAFLACCVRARVWRDRRAAGAFACPAAALAVFLAANIVMGTRFWERHVIYLVPGFIFAAALAGRRVLGTLRGPAPKAAVFALVAAGVLSGFNLVALEEFRKEDYREAAAAARAAGPDHVFFQGHRPTFEYYGLRGLWSFSLVETSAAVESNVNISTASWEDLTNLLARASGRTVLVLSRRAEYDPAGFHPALSGLGRNLNGFALVEASAIPPEALSPETNPMWKGRTYVPSGKWPSYEELYPSCSEPPNASVTSTIR